MRLHGGCNVIHETGINKEMQEGCVISMNSCQPRSNSLLIILCTTFYHLYCSSSFFL